MKNVIVFIMTLCMVLGMSSVGVWADGSWTTKATMPTSRASIGCATVNGIIYVIGGGNRIERTLSTVEAFDPVANTWTTKASLPFKMAGITTVGVNGKIYAIGGRMTSGLQMKETTYVFEYDPATDTWTSKAKMPMAKYGFGATVVDGKIYTIGGFFGARVNTVEVYDPATDKWTSTTNMPTARENLGVEAIGDKIYAFGGTTVNGETKIVEEYDTKTDTWTTKNNLPKARYSFKSVVANGKIYALGGNPNLSRYVEEYDPLLDKWIYKTSIPTDRKNIGTAVANGKIYILGGYDYNKQEYLNIVEEYNLPEEIPSQPTNLTATGGNAKVDLSWGAVSDATIYHVKRSTTSGGVYNTIATSPSITYSDYSVSNDTTYYYVVSAVNSAGESSDSNEASATPKAVEEKRVLSVLLNVKEVVQLSVTYDLEDNIDLTWSSSNEKVATVNSNGKVMAIGEGFAYIYAKNVDGSFNEYIPVRVVLSGADERRLAVHLMAGGQAKLYLAEEAENVTWSSADERIVTVSDIGVISAVNKGLAIIKAEFDGEIYQIYVRVNS